ncbi:MAG: substrate-binding domain-containing protein [Lachnospiraceae bacterium]|nr:substrate-binding domain-containing protein [Lachnospiraceae bacterium]
MVFAIIIAVLEAIVILVLAFMLLKKGGSQGRITHQAELIVKGKLNVEDINLDTTDSANVVLAKAFNSIKNNLMTFVEATKVNMVTLSDAIENLSNTVEANTKGNDQIAESTTDVAVKTAQQLEFVKDNLELIESNSSQMQEIDAEFRIIKDILDNTAEETSNGISKIEDFEKDLSMMSRDLKQIDDILSKFNEEIKRIGEVGDFIVEISNQLRLLAFNASIEAARAGQAGRGFTVVADQMNDMSNKTREGMHTINEILKEINTSSRMVNESIGNCNDTYNRSENAFKDVNVSFRNINESAQNIHEKIGAISQMFNVMTENTDLSRDKAENLYATAQAISEKTHEIAAVSQEVAAESAKIAANTEALGGMLTGTQNLLKQFNTAIVPAEKKNTKQVRILSMSMLDNDFWYGVRKGVFYAQKELSDRDVVIDYIPLIHDDIPLDDKVDDAIQSAIDRKFDGIIFPGFLGGSNERLKKAASSGVKLMSYNCDCDKSVPRIACLRPDAREPGILGAKAVQKKLEGRGNVLMLVGDLTVGVNRERKEGFKMQLESSKGIKIEAELTVPDTADGVYKVAMDGLKAHPDTDVIFLTNGFPIPVVKAIKDSGKSGRTTLVCYDHNQEIFSYIKSGYITAAIGQDAFGQGHDPIIWLYNNIVTGEKLNEFIPCRLSVVDKSNVASLIEA